MNFLKIFVSSLLGGVAIALGNAASLAVKADSAFLSALVFSMGFLAVAVFELSLFTDKASAIFVKGNTTIQLQRILLTLLGNIIGSLIIGIAVIPMFNSEATAVVNAIFEMPLENVFLGAMLCGMLIYIAMHGYRKTTSGITGCLILILATSAIPLCGFNYAIANTFFIGATFKSFELYTRNIASILLSSLFVAFGNAIGAIVFSLLCKLKDSDDDSHKRHRHKSHHHEHSEQA